MSLTVVILAAGKGKRTGVTVPKPLIELHGKPVICGLVEMLQSLNPVQVIVVAGHKSEEIQKALCDMNVEIAIQESVNGTGGALKAALPLIVGSRILVLSADMPLLQAATCEQFINQAYSADAALVTTTLETPASLGRIIRSSDGSFLKIVEAKDASAIELAIKEINAGLYLFDLQFLINNIYKLDNNNAQQEYYLTDLFKFAKQQELLIWVMHLENNWQIKSFNTLKELASIDKEYQLYMADKLQQQGVRIVDCHRIDIRGNVEIAEDCYIDINVIFIGDCKIKAGVVIGANCIIKNSTINENTIIHPFSTIEDSIIGHNNDIGPYARIRPGCITEEKVKIGNFVELKKARVGANSKANHLSYLGDVDIGMSVNIGAGVVTCNYDGTNKYKTVIGNNVFIGSNSELIAPVRLYDNSTIGAGTTLNYDVAANSLAISKKQQTLIQNWVRKDPQKVE